MFTVYPRVGGGTGNVLGVAALSIGLSPRGRGNQRAGVDGALFDGSIPAWAGEPCVLNMPNGVPKVYPRVGGGTAALGPDISRAAGLSPRGRGNHCHRGPNADRSRSIPAWAGEPCVLNMPNGVPKVYPRVGGGTLIQMIA